MDALIFFTTHTTVIFPNVSLFVFLIFFFATWPFFFEIPLLEDTHLYTMHPEAALKGCFLLFHAIPLSSQSHFCCRGRSWFQRARIHTTLFSMCRFIVHSIFFFRPDPFCFPFTQNLMICSVARFTAHRARRVAPPTCRYPPPTVYVLSRLYSII